MQPVADLVSQHQVGNVQQPAAPAGFGLNLRPFLFQDSDLFQTAERVRDKRLARNSLETHLS